ncbi:sulfatase-like hydrolase/transferase [Kordiimonas laminariae]|uniref:sulfatase-like hydrolase/transferase n=1 Tax=Kordiimonas laminariae TaxID=2917717 RepID=UPI001FF6CD35|nr:sulfatase-like hydrolase/transferase [Kordiimonas laminariae]MCK0071218.1 sulfatase-like hydrolase/transferase [Kordiimonas laminariae]
MFKGSRLVFLGLILLIGLEAILLELRYQIFTGTGFLQSRPLSSTFDYMAFIGLYLSSFIILFHLLNKTLFNLTKFIKIRIEKPIFIFGSIFIFLYGISLAARYQIYAYVADHVDMTVINAIAGGDIQNAIAYVKDEIFVFMIPSLIILVIFIVILKLTKPEPNEYEKLSKLHRRYFLGAIGVLVLTAILASNPAIFNGKRTIAFYTILTTGNLLTDFDQDGSSFFNVPRDPAPLDSDIHWGAIDIPGNGIDENGLAGDLPAISYQDQISQSISIPERFKHLVIVVSESTRADILEHKINDQYVAPNLRELAQNGSSISNAFSHAGFTSNSLYTLFSGNYYFEQSSDSIFEAAKQNDFEISIISGQDETWGNLDKRLKTRENADFFFDPQTVPEKRVFASKLPSSIKLSEATLVEAFKKRLSEINPEKRQFFYFNFQAAHFPYSHQFMDQKFVEKGIPRRDITKANREWLSNTYWNALSYMDHYFGEVIGELKQKGLFDETLIIFLGDHGESLFHDGFLGHGHSINRDQLQIPLVLSVPDISFSTPTGLADVYGWMKNYVNAGPHSLDKKGSCVFMHTGHMLAPAQIGQLCEGDIDPEVYTISFDQYAGPAKSPEERENRKIKMVHNWEKIVFEEYLKTNPQN